ncbi:MAG: hypothetical protein RMJ19_06050, partial [Gemmatales bacterium]|nr:hypothetical protein [Gemmatales bacterium]MDW8175215.1 hypothetical protein [Gemmatales bacterium]
KPRTSHLNPRLSRTDNGHDPEARSPRSDAARRSGPVLLARATLAEEIRLARLKGYEGDPCPECGQLTLVRSGACLKCDTCGATSGCS